MQATDVLAKIMKRNGVEELFDAEKITKAIQKAGEATGEFGRDVAEKLTLRVVNIAIQMATVDEKPNVEQIQDIVEEVLISSPYKKTAKSYIIYRDQHTKIREITSASNVNLVDQYLSRADWKVNEIATWHFRFKD